jgi:hypothetical protein
MIDQAAMGAVNKDVNTLNSLSNVGFSEMPVSS